MKKQLISLALCVCLSLSILLGGFGAKATRGGIIAAPHCDLPPEYEDQ